MYSVNKNMQADEQQLLVTVHTLSMGQTLGWTLSVSLLIAPRSPYEAGTALSPILQRGKLRAKGSGRGSQVTKSVNGMRRRVSSGSR